MGEIRRMWTVIRLVQARPVIARGGDDLLGVVHAVCDRVEQVEPHVRALLPEPGRRERLLLGAARLLDRFPDPTRRPYLFGTLVGVKDIFNVDGLPTRAGSAFPAEEFAGPQAESVNRLESVGVLVLGKTVTTEFAYLEPGATSNPHQVECTPGGSSSGSAASVAAGIASLALGTQTVGSVIRPAAYCGVIGFKPSYGRIPTSGVLEFSRSADHVGVFASSVEDLWRAAEILCDDWTGFGSDRPPRLAVPNGAYLDQVEPDARSAFETQLESLAGSGFPVVQQRALSDIAGIASRHMTLIAAEYADVHAERFERSASLFRGRSAEMLVRGRAVSEADRGAALAGCRRLRLELHAQMDDNQLDAWICPSATGPAPMGLGQTGNAAMNLPWTHCGVPVVTLPAGRVHGMPIGLQLVGRHGKDEELLGIAAKLEASLQSV